MHKSFRFQHTAARRRLVHLYVFAVLSLLVSTHSRPKAAGFSDLDRFLYPQVSTHSRPKAAGQRLLREIQVKKVSTHSRPKAAGHAKYRVCSLSGVSTHSRPKAAGKIRRYPPPWVERFNTQPPEGGWQDDISDDVPF